MPKKERRGATVSPVEPLHPEITKVAGVCGGDACIRTTRMPVWVLHRAKLAGVSDRELLESYPFLKRRDLRIAWDYVEAHEDEITQNIQENSW